jgi:hypothetical protein
VLSLLRNARRSVDPRARGNSTSCNGLAQIGPFAHVSLTNRRAEVSRCACPSGSPSDATWNDHWETAA